MAYVYVPLKENVVKIKQYTDEAWVLVGANDQFKWVRVKDEDRDILDPAQPQEGNRLIV